MIFDVYSEKPKNFFIYSCETNTPTDGIIYKGIENILKSIYPSCNFFTLPENVRYFRDSRELPRKTMEFGVKIDAIIVPGSPFIWANFHNTHKIKNLQLCEDIHKCPIVFMGIGACVFMETRGVLLNKTHTKAINDVYKDGLVISRDSIAHKSLLNAGVHSNFLPCPSYFSRTTKPQTKDRKGKSLMVWYDPQMGLSSVRWKDPKKYERYLDIYREFFKTHNPDVVCKDHEEIQSCIAAGFPEPRLLVDSNDTLETVERYECVLSGRVHVAIPAIISGCKTGIISIDSRYLTIQDFVNLEIKSKKDLVKMKKSGYNYNASLGIYQKLIREFLK